MTISTKQNAMLVFRQTLSRFVLPMGSIFLLAIICFLLIHSQPRLFGGFRVRLEPQIHTFLMISLAALYCCKLAFLAHALFYEQRSKRPQLEAILSAALVFVAIFALFLTAAAPWVHMLFLAPGLVLLIMSAGFIGKNYDDLTYCYYNCSLLKAALYGLLVGFIVSSGLSGALAGIAYLFDIRMRPLYMDLWLVGFVLGSYWILARIPRVSDMVADVSFYPKGVASIVSCILAPLVLLYLVILYIYALKITVTWELPRGGVGYMVMACGLLGVLTHFLAYPIREHSTRLVRLLHRWFYPALVVPVILLWIAVFQRIVDYGITEDRYLVLIIATLLTMASVYGIVRRYVPLQGISLSAAMLLIFASFGPWGAVHVSKLSQVAELKAILEEQGVMRDGKIITGKQKNVIIERHPTPEAFKRIQNILGYLHRTKKLDALATWFPRGSVVPGLLSQNKITGWQMIQEMGIAPPGNHNVGPQSTLFNLSRSVAYGEPNSHAFVSTRGFDYMARIQSFRRDNQHSLVAGDKHVSLSLSNDRLIVRDNFGHEASFDIADNIPGLIERYSRPQMQWRTEIPTHESALNLLVSRKDFTAYLMITEMQGNTAWEQGRQVNRLSGYLLLRYGPPLSDEEVQKLSPKQKALTPTVLHPWNMPVPSPQDGVPSKEASIPSQEVSLPKETEYPQSMYMARQPHQVPPKGNHHFLPLAQEQNLLSSITKPAGMDNASAPKSEPFDISIPARLAYEKKFAGKTNRKKGEFVRFGAWDYGDCFNNDQWVCGDLDSGGIGCEANFPECASGKAVAVESYPGDKQCVIRWWKWVCK